MTILVAAWLSDEQITLAIVTGGLLVLAGVYVGAIAAPLRRGTEASPASAD